MSSTATPSPRKVVEYYIPHLRTALKYVLKQPKGSVEAYFASRLMEALLKSYARKLVEARNEEFRVLELDAATALAEASVKYDSYTELQHRDATLAKLSFWKKEVGREEELIFAIGIAKGEADQKVMRLVEKQAEEIDEAQAEILCEEILKMNRGETLENFDMMFGKFREYLVHCLSVVHLATFRGCCRKILDGVVESIE